MKNLSVSATQSPTFFFFLQSPSVITKVKVIVLATVRALSSEANSARYYGDDNVMVMVGKVIQKLWLCFCIK